MSWPISNRAEDLNIDVHYLRRQVGSYLGYGHNPAVWGDEKFQTVEEIIDSGLRQYYFPPSMPTDRVYGKLEAHSWSFMRPTGAMTTEDGQAVYSLPADFDFLIGDITYSDTDGEYYAPLKLTSDARIRALEQTTTTTAQPQLAAVRPVVDAGTAPQRQELVLHPTPNAAYNLSFQYQAFPRKLSDENPYPLGGRGHASGIMASVLAVAELRKMGQEGPMMKNFINQVSSNIARDWDRGPDFLGYNGSGGMGASARGDLRRMNGIFYSGITYNGSAYES